MKNEQKYSWDEMKKKSQGTSTDMSPDAVAKRIDKLASLFHFALMARKARKD